MKYSLRSLFLVVTLICVALGTVGGRIEHLRRMAAFHEREVSRQREKFEREGGNAALQFYLGVHNARIGSYLANDEHRMFIRHEELAVEYRRAVYRPWIIIDEIPAKPTP